MLLQEVPESQIDTNSAYILFYERDGIDYDSYMPKVSRQRIKGSATVDCYFPRPLSQYAENQSQIIV